MLEGGIVAKASGLKPRPSLMYLEAQIYGRDLSCLVDIGAMHSFMSPNLAKELGLQVQNARKFVNVHLPKGKPHKTKEMALDVTLEYENLEFRENFTLYEMDEIDFILGDTFFEVGIASSML
jgi:hypothetical protein